MVEESLYYGQGKIVLWVRSNWIMSKEWLYYERGVAGF